MDIIEIIEYIALFIAFFGSLRYAFESLNYTNFTSGLKKYLKLQRELIILSKSYDDYITKELFEIEKDAN